VPEWISRVTSETGKPGATKPSVEDHFLIEGTCDESAAAKSCPQAPPPVAMVVRLGLRSPREVMFRT